MPAAIDAPCRDFDPDMWFAEDDATLTYAQQLCSTCPLRRPCLAGAIERRETWGVWGGYILRDGVPLERRPRRGRARRTIEVAA